MLFRIWKRYSMVGSWRRRLLGINLVGRSQILQSLPHGKAFGVPLKTIGNHLRISNRGENESEMVLVPIPMWWCWVRVFYPHHQEATLWTPTGCPVSQLNSETIRTASDSIIFHRLRVYSHKTTPIPWLQIIRLGCHLFLWPTSYRWEVPMTPSSLGSINLLKQLTELRETFY